VILVGPKNLLVVTLAFLVTEDTQLMRANLPKEPSEGRT